MTSRTRPCQPEQHLQCVVSIVKHTAEIMRCLVCSLQCAVYSVQCAVCSLQYILWCVQCLLPRLPAGVGVQSLLGEVGVDLSRHLDPLQQLPPHVVVLGEDLVVVRDNFDPALGCVTRHLDGPDKLPHLQVLGAVLPVLRLLPQPVVVRAQDGEERVALRDAKTYKRANNVCVKKISGKIFAKIYAVLSWKWVMLRFRAFWWHFFWHILELYVTFWHFLHYLGLLGLLRCFVAN